MRLKTSLLLTMACLFLVPQSTHAEGQKMYIASPNKPAVIYLCSLDMETAGRRSFRLRT